MNFILSPSLAQILPGPITDPVAIFLIIVTIMLVAPLMFERLRLPGIVGLILAGVVVGPHGLGLLERDSSIILLGTVGLLFLMFLAGLETSLDDLKYSADKALIFGMATFLIPMGIGVVAILGLGYSLLAAILVASTFASHTLLALPILNKLGIMRTQAVTATLGATLVTNVLALLVLGVVIKAHQGTLTLQFWLFLIPALTLYTIATLWGVPKIGRWFFRRFGHDEGAEFVFVLVTLLIVSYVASLIEIEPIIGAFLAGIAITQLIPQISPLMNRIQFIGNTLFVPFFLISVGMLIDPFILVEQPQSIMIAVVIVTVALTSKFIAAWGSAKIFGLGMPNTMVMYGLSVAQAASTLAAITVGYQVELVDELIVNGVIAMILVTSIVSPWITARWGQQIQPHQTATATPSEQAEPLSQRVLVPVANPNTEDNLLQLALILAKTSDGTLLPLHVLSDQAGYVRPEAKVLQTQLLSAAEMVAHSANTQVEPIGRVDDAIDKGITRTAIEYDATLIICGWKGYSTTRENFFGGIIDNVAKRSPVPLFITRFPQPLKNTQRVLLAVSEQEISLPLFQKTLTLTQKLANELKAKLHLVLVVTSPKHARVSPESLGISRDMSVIQVRGNFVKKVSRLLENNDLLVLMAYTPSSSVFTLPGPLIAEPEAIARANPDSSMIVAYFPRLPKI